MNRRCTDHMRQLDQLENTLRIVFKDFLLVGTIALLTCGCSSPSKPEPGRDEWVHSHTLPMTLELQSAAVVGKYIYILPSNVFRYSPNTGIFEDLADFPLVDAYQVGATGMGSSVITAGGWHRFGNNPVTITTISRVFRFRPDQNYWNELSAMPVEKGFACVETVNGSVYVVAGGEGGETLSAPSFDNMTWSVGATIPTNRSGTSSAVIDGKIYVIGGNFDGTSRSILEIYDPETDTWSTGASMSAARRYAACGVMFGRLYVAGGEYYDQDSDPREVYLSSAEYYDPATDTWHPATEMPGLRSRASSAVINDVLYVLGGKGRVTPDAPLQLLNDVIVYYP